MSTLSSASKLLKGSERESNFNWRAIAMVAGSIFLLVLAVRFIGDVWGGRAPFGVVTSRPMPDATAPATLPTQAVFAMATDEPRPTAWPTPIILEREIVSVVTVEIPGPVRYIDVPLEVEVTRIVEIFSIPVPTVTPIPLASGTVRICVTVEGAKQLYVDGAGITSGECREFVFGVGQTSIPVQINR